MYYFLTRRVQIRKKPMDRDPFRYGAGTSPGSTRTWNRMSRNGLQMPYGIK